MLINNGFPYRAQRGTAKVMASHDFEARAPPQTPPQTKIHERPARGTAVMISKQQCILYLFVTKGNRAPAASQS